MRRRSPARTRRIAESKSTISLRSFEGGGRRRSAAIRERFRAVERDAVVLRRRPPHRPHQFPGRETSWNSPVHSYSCSCSSCFFLSLLCVWRPFASSSNAENRWGLRRPLIDLFDMAGGCCWLEWGESDVVVVCFVLDLPCGVRCLRK